MLNPQRVPGKEQKAFEKRGNLLFHGSFKVSTAGFAGSGFFMLYVHCGAAAMRATREWGLRQLNKLHKNGTKSCKKRIIRCR